MATSKSTTPMTMAAVEAAWARGEEVSPSDYQAAQNADEMAARKAAFQRQAESDRRRDELDQAMEHYQQVRTWDSNGAEAEFREGIDALVVKLHHDLAAASAEARAAGDRLSAAITAAGRRGQMPEGLQTYQIHSGPWAGGSTTSYASRLLARAAEDAGRDLTNLTAASIRSASAA